MVTYTCDRCREEIKSGKRLTINDTSDTLPISPGFYPWQNIHCDGIVKPEPKLFERDLCEDCHKAVLDMIKSYFKNLQWR